ncbi:hypothetical protein [Cupriavidus necator]
MSRISRIAVARAMTAVKAMSIEQKEKLLDEIFHAQPHMLGSVLALPKLGVSMEKVAFALQLLLVCFVAMKESGFTWPLITEDHQESQLQIYTSTIRLGKDLSPTQRDRLILQYVENHPEKHLCAYVRSETATWLRSISPEDSDKYVILAVSNFVNCIAYEPIPKFRK